MADLPSLAVEAPERCRWANPGWFQCPSKVKGNNDPNSLMNMCVGWVTRSISMYWYWGRSCWIVLEEVVFTNQMPIGAPFIQWKFQSYFVSTYFMKSYLVLSYFMLYLVSYPILPYPILSYLILSYLILYSSILSYLFLSFLILCYLILSCLSLSYPILLVSICLRSILTNTRFPQYTFSKQNETTRPTSSRSTTPHASPSFLRTPPSGGPPTSEVTEALAALRGSGVTTLRG